MAIYSVCKVAGASVCADWGIGSGSGSTLLGYALAPSLPQVPGTVPLYSNCAGNCVASTMGGTLLGYMYPRHLDRARVVMRAANDGRGVTQTTTYTYSDAGLSSDGSEFRGYASARTIDTAGTFTDSWFYQDDARRDLLYHAQTRNGSNALLRETINTFTTSTPYPGVTFTALTQADTVTCDGACR